MKFVPTLTTTTGNASMKRILTALAASLALSAALGVAGTAPAQAAGELYMFNWGDYTNPDLIKKFEDTYGVKVTLDDYDSN